MLSSEPYSDHEYIR